MVDRAQLDNAKCTPTGAATRDILFAQQANTVLPMEDGMERRRFQRGTVMLRGKHWKVWVGRWREDELRPDGTTHRKRRAEVLGTVDDYPTKRLALRALEAKLVEINDTSYRPRMAMTFKAFAERWQQDVLSTHKPSTESSIKSQLRTGLVPAFGSIALRDVTGERVQQFISCSGVVPRRYGTMSPHYG
jgi:hypothetical protein